jgi:two-component system sensor histidine kinase YesM
MIVLSKSRKDIIQIVESNYSSTSVNALAVELLPYFPILKSNPGKVTTKIVTDPFIKSKKINMIPIVYTIPDPYQANDIGYVFTEMSLSAIINPIQNYLTETNSQFYFNLGDYQYRFENNTLVPNKNGYKILKDLSDHALRSDTVVQRIRNEDGEGTSIMITRPLDTDGWNVAVCLDETELSRNILHTFLVIALIIIVSSSFIGILLSLFLYKTVNVPVKKLQERIIHISNGDFRRDTSIEWKHELGDIGKNINILSEKILLLLNQRIEDERQKKDYEYKMLQSQINPHFLYNTLNSIKWMATIQNAPGIAEMTTALSRLLKDISKGTSNLITIQHEISLINDYFTIQKYRYGGTMTLVYNIEDKALTSCNILKFTLQPIVENAIFHGLEPKGGVGTIEFHIYQDENTDVHIDITDNGIGMDANLISNLTEKEYKGETAFFKEIGISNVNKLLQYEFGNQYGLTIKSKLNEFSTVSILLPYTQNAQEVSYD